MSDFIGNRNAALLLGEDLDHILLKFAINAAEQGRKVWFLSLKPLEVVPRDIEPPCKDVLQLITFIYFKSFEEILKHFNDIHKWRMLPSVVIVKRLDEYCQGFGQGTGLMQAACLSAVLLDCLSILGRKTPVCRPCLVTTCKASVPKSSLKVLCDFYFDYSRLVQGINEDELIDEIRTRFLEN